MSRSLKNHKDFDWLSRVVSPGGLWATLLPLLSRSAMWHGLQLPLGIVAKAEGIDRQV